MTYYPIDTDNDGTVEADVDNATTSTEQINNGRTGSVLMDQSESWSAVGGLEIESVSDTSATSYESVAKMQGAIPSNTIPDGATLYGLFLARVSSLSSGETGNYRPRVFECSSSTISGIELTELELEFTSATFKSTGWTELTSLTPTDFELITGQRVEGKVTGGTMSADDRGWGLVFDWRVD